jgi:hypothetical protein
MHGPITQMSIKDVIIFLFMYVSLEGKWMKQQILSTRVQLVTANKMLIHATCFLIATKPYIHYRSGHCPMSDVYLIYSYTFINICIVRLCLHHTTPLSNMPHIMDNVRLMSVQQTVRSTKQNYDETTITTVTELSSFQTIHDDTDDDHV